MISFVVPAYNEEDCLPATLRAIHAAARAAGRRYEIVVTDDASADRTAEVAREGGARVAPVRVRQISRSRNAGARAARGDYLIFVDADTRVTPGAVRGAVRALDRGAAGGGATIAFDGEIPGWARLILVPSARLYHVLGLASGCFLFCTRAAFEATGGFDESVYAGEEIAMSFALKRVGRLVVLRERVFTSPRKLHAYTARELLVMLLRIVSRGPRGLRSRKGLHLWYRRRSGRRRTVPDSEKR